MSPLVSTTFRLESELIQALQELKERDGVPATESVRRAIKAWLEQKGVEVQKGIKVEKKSKAQKSSKAKAPRKRVRARNRG